ncbi:MAG: cupin domain-containing protein, partial [Gramella sp.]|nr:cupin domain-containing protein [Christiangramia sp.]
FAVDINNSTLEWGGCPDFMPEGCNISVLQGDPALGNSDVLFKVPANTDIPMHWHNSAERMILISGEMDVTYEGEETQTLKSGTYAYGPAKKPHTARCKDSGPCVLFIAFIDAVDAFAGKPD